MIGVARLEHADLETATFHHATGEAIPWISLHQKQGIGVRAALELLRAAAVVVADAAANARRAGLAAHGAISPWRVAVARDGSVQLLAYGFPPVDVLAWLDEEAEDVAAEGLRYLAPEVLEDAELSVRTDWYGLGLMAAELAAGVPVFEGTAEVIARQVVNGGGPAGVERIGGGFPDAVFELLATAVERDPTRRHADLADLLAGIDDALEGLTGPSLRDVLDDVFPAVPVAAPPAPEPVAVAPVAVPAREDPTRGRASRLLDTIAGHLSAIAASERVAEELGSAVAVAAAREAARRAKRAEESANTASRLLDLDEDEASAAISLDLVVSAERAAATAAGAAEAALEDARREAAEAADRAAAVARASERASALLIEIAAWEAPPLSDPAARARVELAQHARDEARREAAAAVGGDPGGLDRAAGALARSAAAEAQAHALEEEAVLREQERLKRAELSRSEAVARLSRAHERGAEAAAAAGLDLPSDLTNAAGAAPPPQTPTDLAGWMRVADLGDAEARRVAGLATAAEAAAEALAARAGAAIALAAARRKRRDEDVNRFEAARREHAACAAEVAQALADSSGLRGAMVLSGRSDAEDALTAAVTALADMERALAAETGGDEVERKGARVAEAAALARGAVRRVRESARAELAERERLQTAAVAIRELAELATARVGAARTQLDAAWARIRSPSAALRDTWIESARSSRNRAFEIADIADFQMGEAESAAALCAAQTDAAEARGYADTAASFVERVAEDLPEALVLWDQAESLVAEELAQLADARESTETALVEVDRLAAEVDAAVAAARAEAETVSGAAIRSAIAALEGAAVGIDGDRDAVRAAAAEAARVERSALAREQVPPASHALERALGRLEAVRSARVALSRVVAEAQAEVRALEAARIEARASLHAAGDAAVRARAARQALDDAVGTHRAVGEASVAAVAALRRAEDLVQAALTRCQEATGTAEEAADPGAARAAARLARVAQEQALAAAESVGEAQRRGVLAAEGEAVARAEAEARRRAAALERVERESTRAREAVKRVNDLLSDPQLTRADLSLARERPAAEAAAEQARSWLEAGPGPGDDPVVLADAWHELADRVVAEAARAAELAEAAIDHVRAAQAEAEALAQILAEIEQVSGRLAAERSRGEGEVARLAQVALEDGTVREQLLKQAHQLVALTAAAAAKVAAAHRIAAEASEPSVASPVLQSCRAALQRAAEAVVQIGGLVREAERRAEEEAAERAGRLHAARAALLEPLQALAEEAQKLDGFLAVARDQAPEVDAEAVDLALVAFVDAVDAARRSKHEAEVLGAQVNSATGAALERLEDPLRFAVERGKSFCRDARALRDEFAKKRVGAVEERAAIAEIQLVAARLTVGAGEASAELDRGFIRVRETLAPFPGIDAGGTLARLDVAAARAAGAYASAERSVRAALGATSRGAAIRAADEARDALDEGLEALGLLVEVEAALPAAIAEQRRAEQRRRVEPPPAPIPATDDVGSTRRLRDEARRDRFDRLKASGVSEGTPPANTREALRDRLRSDTQTRGDSEARPRRRPPPEST